MSKVLITTSPFGEYDKKPIDILEKAKIDFQLNDRGRKFTEQELIERVRDVNVLIAGTETISAKVMDAASNLQMISRVGVGLNSVDLSAARERGVAVSYTPEAPAPAVAELTVALILSLLRMINISNIDMHKRKWTRFFGRRLSNITVGVIGAGRIGGRFIQHLDSFGKPKVLVNDLITNKKLVNKSNVEYVSKNEIFKNADVVTLHLPLTKATKNLVTRQQLLIMKNDALIINTARGGIIDEDDLFSVLTTGHLQGAAVDVFDTEPYCGPLCSVKNCLLTSHMGSMSIDCRSRMELEATEEAIRFLKNQDMKSPVPQYEYELQL